MSPKNDSDPVLENGESPVFEAEKVLRPREQVEQQIKRAILTGVFRQGERLPAEASLATQFSVSRTTVREALRALAEAGLITKSPGVTGGSFVERVDPHALGSILRDRLNSTLELGSISYDEVGAFRNLLEVPSASLAALNRTDEQLADIRAVVDREKAVEVDDPEVPELNIRFHTAIAEATGNRLLSAFISALHRAAHPLAFISTSKEVGRDAVKDHIRIATAISEQDPDAAAKAMEDHLDFLKRHAAT
jgi:GntR family transcriptional repressor for pyruvate dehydrogenase complex